MNKAEIERRIKRYELVMECAEENLNDLNIQLCDLAEAEKPKIQHGDFWETNTGGVISIGSGLNREDYNKFGEIGSYLKPDDILGNIFNLLEEWSEDLEEYKNTGWGTGMLEVIIRSEQSALNKLIEFRIQNSSATFTLPEAEEVWRKLGQLIATLKRKAKQ